MPEAFTADVVARLLALFVHDARNPLAAAVANVSYVRGEVESQDHREALDDARLALATLTRLLEQLAIAGASVSPERAEPWQTNVVHAVRTWSSEAHSLRIDAAFHLDEAVASGGALVRLGLDIAESVAAKAGASSLVVSVALEGAFVRVDVEDDGMPLRAEAASGLFDAEAQLANKDCGDGRYAGGAGWLALAMALRAAGGSAEVAPQERGARVTLRLPLLTFREGAQGAL